MCHVLIIEDEPIVALDLEALLADAGATSFAFASSQDEAVEAALAEPPGLITSDVELVEGSGPAAVAIIRDQLGVVPVIYITGTPGACSNCHAPDRVLTKPYNRYAIADAFHALVEGNARAQ